MLSATLLGMTTSTLRAVVVAAALVFLGCSTTPTAAAPTGDPADVPAVQSEDVPPAEPFADSGPWPDAAADIAVDVPADPPPDTFEEDAADDIGVDPDLEEPEDIVGDEPDVAVVDDAVELDDAVEVDDAVETPDTTPDVADPPKSWLDLYPLKAQFPEGGIYDAAGHAFYVGSLGDGSVHRVDANTGEETVIFTPDDSGVWWTLGMSIDATNELLFVCAMDDQSDFTDDDPPYDGYIWVFDLLTGEQVADHDLSDAFPTATCTDVTLTSDGTAYVVDREHPNIYRITPQGDLSLFTSDDDLSGFVAGQNGVVVLPDESALLVIVYLYPDLLRVDLDTGVVTAVDIKGSFFDAAALAGADGIALLDGAAWVAFTSELVRVIPTTAGWGKATATEIDVPYGMTDVLATPNALYLLNGQAVAFALGQSPDPFQLVRFTGDL